MKIENKKAKYNETLYYIIMWKILHLKVVIGKFRLLHLHASACGISDSVVILM